MLRNRHSVTSTGLPTSHDGGGSGGGYSGGSGGGYQGGAYGGYSGGNTNGYGGYNAQSSMSSASGSSPDKYASKRRGGSGGGFMAKAPLFGCIFFALWAITGTFMNLSKSRDLKQIFKEAGNSKSVAEVVEHLHAERRRTHGARKEAKDVLREQTNKHRGKVGEMEDKIRMLTEHRDKLVDKHESAAAKSKKKEKREIRRWREDAYYDQLELLYSRVRKDSKRSILERFGPGPHKVAFYFRMPDGAGNLGPEQRIVFQMAPLDLVPHAVHHFLEQVEHGLWGKETYFYLSGPHVLQAGPQAWEEDHPDMTDEEFEFQRIQHFHEADLEELIFPDYSDEHPHAQYTLGLTGRPGGPDFYINKADNQATHGPGGQDQHAIEHQADACFAKVVDGFTAFEQLSNAKTYADEGWEWMIEEPVPIVRAEILTKRPPQSAPADKKRELNDNNRSSSSNQQQQQQYQPPQQQQQQQQQEQQQQQYQPPQQQQQQQEQQQQRQQQQQYQPPQQQQQQQYQPPQQQQQQQQQQEGQNYDGNHRQHGHHARLPPEHGRVAP